MSYLAPVTWGRVTGQADKIVILGSGPSVQDLDLEHLEALQRDAGAYIITVNGASGSAPFADAWFTLDPHHLRERLTPNAGNKWYAAIPDDFGTPYCRTIHYRATPPAQVTYLHRLIGNGTFASKFGLSEDPCAIYTGNSGYGALGLAYHMRPKQILLLGIDCTYGYFYDAGARSGNLDHLPTLFESAVYQLEGRGITVVNGSPNSAITCFRRTTPSDGVREMYD